MRPWTRRPACLREQSLVKQFYKFRLHTFAKQERDRRRNTIAAKRSGGERASKSMQMRKSVETIK
jgi:hypothetical protein